MKNQKESECFYLCIKTPSLDSVPKDKDQCSSFCDASEGLVISALEKGKRVRAIILSEGLLVGCAQIVSSRSPENTNTQEGAKDASFHISYERIVLFPMKQILAIFGAEMMDEKLTQEEAVGGVLPVQLGEFLWELTLGGGHEALSLLQFARYDDYITSFDRMQAGNRCTGDHLTSAKEISLAMHCGRLPIQWDSIRRHLVELLDIPDSIILFRRFFAQEIPVADLINVVEDILTEFDTFSKLPIASEMFQCILGKLSPFPLLLKELYLAVESKLVGLLHTQGGLSIVSLMADSLPDVGKRSLARSVANVLQSANTGFAVCFIKQALAKHEGLCNTLNEAIEPRC
ncbi:exodeoxyribonuclease V gamma chain [Perkinsela sp. CCAP 1560/4]|nr:exodeoxyribonuclease V gamma chain [Perkinsela sp. CCAP 1560/4]|eukprot:KNH06091.1 exodeoxyribonuclease V gamma chain [Perkinsela sp. CCAP 1560/4]